MAEKGLLRLDGSNSRELNGVDEIKMFTIYRCISLPLWLVPGPSCPILKSLPSSSFLFSAVIAVIFLLASLFTVWLSESRPEPPPSFSCPPPTFSGRSQFSQVIQQNF